MYMQLLLQKLCRYSMERGWLLATVTREPRIVRELFRGVGIVGNADTVVAHRLGHSDMQPVAVHLWCDQSTSGGHWTTLFTSTAAAGDASFVNNPGAVASTMEDSPLAAPSCLGGGTSHVPAQHSVLREGTPPLQNPVAMRGEHLTGHFHGITSPYHSIKRS